MLKNILDEPFSKASFNCFFFPSPELCHMVEIRLIFIPPTNSLSKFVDTITSLRVLYSALSFEFGYLDE